MFIDRTNYMNLYKLEPRELAKVIVKHVLETTGITASAELHILSNMVDKIKKV